MIKRIFIGYTGLHDTRDETERDKSEQAQHKTVVVAGHISNVVHPVYPVNVRFSSRFHPAVVYPVVFHPVHPVNVRFLACFHPAVVHLVHPVNVPAVSCAPVMVAGAFGSSNG
jgi:hypothetical protein